MDAGQAAVVMDALLEQGTATWPGVGHFALVLREPRARLSTALEVHDFPRREVEFSPAPEVRGELVREGGAVELAGFGRFELLGPDTVRFEAAPALRARLVHTPASRFVPAGAPSVVARLHEFTEPPAPPKRPWWRRWFG